MKNEISRDLLDFRTKHNLLLKDVAEYCGLSYVTVCSIERGGRDISRLSENKLRMFMKEYEEGKYGTIGKADDSSK